MGDDHLFNVGFLKGFLLNGRLNLLMEETQGIKQRIDLNDFVFARWIDHLGRQLGQFLDQMAQKLNQVGLIVLILLLTNQSYKILGLHDRVEEIVFLSTDILLAIFHEEVKVGRSETHVRQAQLNHDAQEVRLEVGKGRLDLDSVVQVAKSSQDKLLRHETLGLIELSDNE
jgi:hypothetical protein